MDWDDWYYPPSKPKEAKGGIKAQTRRGAFGQSWWARRWIKVLEGFDLESRLTRGRSYARKGQVLNVDIAPGHVTAKVQGSRPKPYSVGIRVKPLSEADWKRVGEALSEQAGYVARLLAGEMPEDIESAFARAGVSLFPEKLAEIETNCSCPDWSNPCKHIAAVYYLLGEEFDRDPFLIFRLRGMDREKLLASLGPTADVPEEAATALPREPLPGEPTAFWGRFVPARGPEEATIPANPAALPRQLGSFPFWRGANPFLEAVREVYAAASPGGLAVAAGLIPDASSGDPAADGR